MKQSVLLVFGVLFGIPLLALAQPDTADQRELLQRLAQGDRKVIPALLKQGETVIPELVKLVKNSPREEKAMLTHVLAEVAIQVGPKAKAAIPVLCEALQSTEKASASASARALGAIGTEAVPEVTKTLQAVEKQREALYPLRALIYLGPRAKDALPAVLSTLKANEEPHIRVACIRVLGAVGPAGASGVKDLLKLAQTDKKASYYYMAHLLTALGDIGPGAKEAVPFLGKMLRETPEPHLRMLALESLARIDPAARKERTDALVKMLADPELPRVMILESMAKYGPLDKQLLKAVEESLLDKDVQVRLQAAIVIGRMNADHPAVVSILIESLQEREPNIRRLAAEAIGQVRPSDEAVIEALNRRANDSDPGVRKAVAGALAKFKKK